MRTADMDELLAAYKALIQKRTIGLPINVNMARVNTGSR